MTNSDKIGVNLRRIVPKMVIEINKVKVVPMLELNANLRKRIFVDGKAENGKIGSYSTKPSYVSVEGQKNRTGSQVSNKGLKARGKYGDTKFKNGKQRKSAYFETGYAGLRKALGRQNRFVDLNLTGNLEKSIVVGTRAKGVSLGFKDSESAKLAGYHEEKFGKDIFNVTESEEKEVIKAIDEMVDDIFENLISKL